MNGCRGLRAVSRFESLVSLRPDAVGGAFMNSSLEAWGRRNGNRLGVGSETARNVVAARRAGRADAGVADRQPFAGGRGAESCAIGRAQRAAADQSGCADADQAGGARRGGYRWLRGQY